MKPSARSSALTSARIQSETEAPSLAATVLTASSSQGMNATLCLTLGTALTEPGGRPFAFAMPEWWHKEGPGKSSGAATHGNSTSRIPREYAAFPARTHGAARGLDKPQQRAYHGPRVEERENDDDGNDDQEIGTAAAFVGRSGVALAYLHGPAPVGAMPAGAGCSSREETTMTKTTKRRGCQDCGCAKAWHGPNGDGYCRNRKKVTAVGCHTYYALCGCPGYMTVERVAAMSAEIDAHAAAAVQS